MIAKNCDRTGIRNQEFPQEFYSGMGHTRSGTRNTRVQELPRGHHGWGTLSTQGRPAGWSPTPDPSILERMGPKKDTVLDPNDPRILWQYFTRLEQNAKGKWKSQCQCCGKFYIDFTPSKILEHYGFESTRATPAKFKACKGIDNEENKQVKETAQRIHAAQFMAKSAQKAAKAQGSCTQQAADDEYFVSHGLNVDQLRASGHLPVHNSAIVAAFANATPRKASSSAAESPGESAARPVVQKLSEAAKDKLDETWAAAVYELALPFNLLEHPSIRKAIDTTADLVRTHPPSGVLPRTVGICFTRTCTRPRTS